MYLLPLDLEPSLKISLFAVRLRVSFRMIKYVGLFFLRTNHITVTNAIHEERIYQITVGERGGSVVECRTPEREVRGSRPTAAVLCP